VATVASVLTSARYDLRDTNTKYADAELVAYANRGLVQLDAVLSSINSDWVDTTAAVTLASGASSATAPTRCLRLRQVWYDTTQLIPAPLSTIRYKQQVYSDSTGQPTYYALNGSNIQFDIVSDAAYALTAMFDQRSADLTSGGNMPYGDEFNEPLRESIVIMAKRRDEFDVNLDAILYDFFMSAATQKAMARIYVPKPYYLGF